MSHGSGQLFCRNLDKRDRQERTAEVELVLHELLVALLVYRREQRRDERQIGKRFEAAKDRVNARMATSLVLYNSEGNRLDGLTRR